MPNHVRHRVWAYGPKKAMEKFLKRHFTEQIEQGEANAVFDFQTVIPKPDIVNKTQSGSEADLGERLILVLEGKGNYSMTQDDWRVKKQGNETVEEAIRRYLDDHPDTEKYGRAQIQCRKATGYANWYAWCNHRWGTKWNAYDGKIERVWKTGEGDNLSAEFVFSTAWSVPEPIFEKLAEMNPEVTIHACFLDEGFSFGGRLYFNDIREEGGFEYEYDLSPDAREGREFYEEVYGEVYGVYEC